MYPKITNPLYKFEHRQAKKVASTYNVVPMKKTNQQSKLAGDASRLGENGFEVMEGLKKGQVKEGG